MFWVYTHDDDGDILRDFGDFKSFSEALDAVQDAMTDNSNGEVYRIVNEEDDGTTAWIAGPVDYMRRFFKD